MADSVEKKSMEQESPSKESTDKQSVEQVREHGGPKGPEPTRYGDWEKKGQCVDF